MKTRDPWFPITLMLIVLLGIWLGILGPLTGVEAWLMKWQTLVAASVAATVASVAAYIAFRNTSRSLAHNEVLEGRRRGRKHAALRAMLPLALAAVTDYAERSARGLNKSLEQCEGEIFPPMSATDDMQQPLPTDALTTLRDFIEYSDDVDVNVLEGTVAWVQIHDSRVRGLVADNLDPSHETTIVRSNIEGSIVDAAAIYAGAGAVYDYARRRSGQIAHILTWDEVRRALRNMRFWDEQHPRLYSAIERSEKSSAGPFEKIG